MPVYPRRKGVRATELRELDLVGMPIAGPIVQSSAQVNMILQPLPISGLNARFTVRAPVGP